jgi:putative GTP pyrophosphokinase
MSSEILALSHSQYQELVRPAKRALEQLELDLKWYLEDIGDSTVHLIKTRIKDYGKAIKKLQDKQYTSVDQITDLAGMRIVVHSRTDVDAMVGLFKGQEIRKDLEILEDVCCKDENGYAARHLIVKISPSYKRSAFDVKIEVQIRTLAEDLFDTLSRRMWHKSTVNTPEKSDELLRSLVRNLREVDEIVVQIREKWEDAYAQASPNSEMTPHSFRRIVAEIFHEEVSVDDAVENVRFLRDRGVKRNGDLRSIFTSPDIHSKADQLISWNHKIFGNGPHYVVYMMIAAHPGMVELLTQTKMDEEKCD